MQGEDHLLHIPEVIDLIGATHHSQYHVIFMILIVHRLVFTKVLRIYTEDQDGVGPMANNFQAICQLKKVGHRHCQGHIPLMKVHENQQWAHFDGKAVPILSIDPSPTQRIGVNGFEYPLANVALGVIYQGRFDHSRLDKGNSRQLIIGIRQGVPIQLLQQKPGAATGGQLPIDPRN